MRRSRRLTPEHARHERSDRAADLHRRPLAPAGAAGAEGENRGQRLHRRDALAHQAAALVKGLDHRVAAAARRLRREPRGEDPARQRPERRDQRHEPEPRHLTLREVPEHRLPMSAQPPIPHELPEEQPLDELEPAEEEHRDDPGADTDERGVEQGAADEAEIDRGGVGEEQGHHAPASITAGRSALGRIWHRRHGGPRARSGKADLTRNRLRCNEFSCAGDRRRFEVDVVRARRGAARRRRGMKPWAQRR